MIFCARTTPCRDCSAPCAPTFRFCPNCGNAQDTVSTAAKASCITAPRHTSALALLCAGLLIVVAGATAPDASPGAEGVRQCKDGADGEHCKKDNQELFMRIEELYQKEQARQRAINFENADREENGPKEISIFCPQNPQVRIVDLPSNGGDNDECMVLNLSAPDMNSRLVINCHGKRSAQRMSAEKTTAEQDERGHTTAES